MNLTDDRTPGRSGLAVSPLALGTMTFGAGRWGADEATSRAILDAYPEAGGDFMDTADMYLGGESEAMLGRFLRDAGQGDRLYHGFFNAPAGYVAQIATLARAHGLPEPIGLQYGYSLTDRAVAAEVGGSTAQVAPAWVANRPGVSSVLMGQPAGPGAGECGVARHRAVARPAGPAGWGGGAALAQPLPNLRSAAHGPVRGNARAAVGGPALNREGPAPGTGRGHRGRRAIRA